MKYLSFPVFAMMLLAGCKSSQNHKVPDNFNGQFSKVKEGLYFSKYEVSNKQYRNFVDKNRSGVPNVLPDTLVFNTDLQQSGPLTTIYYSYPSYDNYPVVGIDLNRANAYCEWLTKDYNQKATRKFKQVIFRLPTESEWEFAASGGKSGTVYPWEGLELKNSKGGWNANFKNEADALVEKETRIKITAPVNSFKANGFGLYNMGGNVAELVAGGEVSKGGSWKQGPEKMKISENENFVKTNAYTGFRPVMEVLEP